MTHLDPNYGPLEIRAFNCNNCSQDFTVLQPQGEDFEDFQNSHPSCYPTWYYFYCEDCDRASELRRTNYWDPLPTHCYTCQTKKTLKGEKGIEWFVY